MYYEMYYAFTVDVCHQTRTCTDCKEHENKGVTTRIFKVVVNMLVPCGKF